MGVGAGVGVGLGVGNGVGPGGGTGVGVGVGPGACVWSAMATRSSLSAAWVLGTANATAIRTNTGIA